MNGCNRYSVFCCVALSWVLPAALASQPEMPKRPRTTAKWTVMVFMNGDNNLEQDAITNFEQMAAVPNSSEVNIVVQFDRIAGDFATIPDWDQTLRFQVKQGMQPLPAVALADLGEMDMGDTATIHAFVTWSKREYPAQHYLLIIWNHGQGWRFAPGFSKSQEKSPYRSISTDDTNDGHTLYNRGIQEALSKEPVDIVGFDACLMAMVESAYAFRGFAKYMVGSEDLIPGAGWKYDDWLSQLVANPSMTPRQLSILLVNSYKRTYEQQDPTTTLSAIDLSKMSALATAVSLLADALRPLTSTSAQSILDARTESHEFAPNHRGDGKNYFHHVDLHRFASRVVVDLNDPNVRSSAEVVEQRVNDAVIANYAGSLRQGDYGASGLAIYFPLRAADYANDGFEEDGYKKNNSFWPVAFVQDATWGDFLNAYWTVIQ